MRVCGCEISAQEVRLAVVELNDEQNVELLWIKKTRIELKDDADSTRQCNFTHGMMREAAMPKCL